MSNYIVIIDTEFGRVRFQIQAENYESADAFAEQMNQGYTWVEEVDDE